MAAMPGYGRGRGGGRGRGQIAMGRGQNNIEMFERHSSGLHTSYTMPTDPDTGFFKLHIRSIPTHWNQKALENALLRVCEPINLQKLLKNPKCPLFYYTFVDVATMEEVEALFKLCHDPSMDGIEVLPATRTKMESDAFYLLDSNQFDYVSSRPGMSNPHQQPTTHTSLSNIIQSVPNCKKTVVFDNNKMKCSYDIIGDNNFKVKIPDEASIDRDTTLFNKWVYEETVKIDQENKRGSGTCEWCRKPSHLGCAVCHACYCSEDCYNQDWSGHSKICKFSTTRTNDSIGNESDNQGHGGSGDSRKKQFTNGYKDNESENQADSRGQRRFEENLGSHLGGPNRFRQPVDENRRQFRGNQFEKGNRFGENHNQSFDTNVNRQSNDGNRFGQNMYEERKARFERQNQSSEANRFQRHNNKENENSNYARQTSGTPTAEKAGRQHNFLPHNQFTKVTNIKASKGTNPQIFHQDVFLVKPEFKDTDSIWVVDAIPTEDTPLDKLEVVAPASSKTVKQSSDCLPAAAASPKTVPQSSDCLPAADASPKTVPRFPDYLPADKFTTVSVTLNDESSKIGDTYFVATTQTLKALADMCKSFQGGDHDEKIHATIGALGITSYDGMWYRVKVISTSPFKVFYIDYGNIEDKSPNDLRRCPESHREIEPLVQKVKLAPGTDKKYFNLPENSEINIMPVALIDDTVIVKVEGEAYDEKLISNLVTEMTCPLSISSEDAKIAKLPPVKQEPASPQQAQLEPTPQPSLSPTLPPSNSQTSCQESIKLPDIFSQEGYTSVIITVSASDSNEVKDTYFVTPREELGTVDNISYELEVLSRDCKVFSPKIGDLAIAIFEKQWYRVKVVSVSPLKVFYIDFGNTEDVDSVWEIPDKLKNVKPLACKIKLAPGTSQKFFNKDNYSELKVKPIATLPCGTVIVQVEGESYDVPVTSIMESAPQTQQPNKTNPSYLVDLLCEKWEIIFVPTKLDGKTLFGTATSLNLPETDNFVFESNFNSKMEAEPMVSSYIPKVGDLVVCKSNFDWSRARVLLDKMCALVDEGDVVRESSVKKLVEQYVNIPYLAAEFSLLNDDSDLLNKFNDAVDIKLTVVKVADSKGERSVQVKGVLEGIEFQGALKKWDCNLLGISYPLFDKDSVIITAVIDSNTVMIAPEPEAEFDVDQAIQEACNQSTETFSTPPKVGDFVVLHSSLSKCFYRSRVVSIFPESNEYELYKIDIGSHEMAALSSLRPLPTNLSNLAKRATQVEMKGVDKISLIGLNEDCKQFLELAISEKIKFGLEIHQDDKTVTLKVVDSNLNFNIEVQNKIKPKPDLSGKHTVMTMPSYCPPLNKPLKMIVALEEPLYMQVTELVFQFIEVQKDMDIYFTTEKSYNPCVGELCLVNWEEFVYRAVCFKETNTGQSSVMLIDYGNVIEVPTSDIRKMSADFLTIPALGLACKIKGDEPGLAQIRAKLTVNSQHKVIVESIDEESDNLIISLPELML